MINDIRNAIRIAADNDQKMAMFHFLVLKNANELDGMKPEAFCTEVGVPLSYQTEFPEDAQLGAAHG